MELSGIVGTNSIWLFYQQFYRLKKSSTNPLENSVKNDFLYRNHLSEGIVMNYIFESANYNQIVTNFFCFYPTVLDMGPGIILNP